jgi:hypothetical protein
MPTAHTTGESSPSFAQKLIRRARKL